MTTQRKYRFATFNLFEIRIPADIIANMPPSGAADNAISYARQDEFVIAELAKIEPAKLATELKEYGAWMPEQLASHEDNLDRILWLAIGNIQEELNDFKIGDEVTYGDETYIVENVLRADDEFPNGILWLNQGGHDGIVVDILDVTKVD